MANDITVHYKSLEERQKLIKEHESKGLTMLSDTNFNTMTFGKLKSKPIVMPDLISEMEELKRRVDKIEQSRT